MVSRRVGKNPSVPIRQFPFSYFEHQCPRGEVSPEAFDVRGTGAGWQPRKWGQLDFCRADSSLSTGSTENRGVTIFPILESLTIGTTEVHKLRAQQAEQEHARSAEVMSPSRPQKSEK
jgi:hypothetical protein